jgi:hypothetical protein
MGQLSEADATDAKEAKDSAIPATDRASVVLANLKFRLRFLFYDETLFRHLFSHRCRTGSADALGEEHAAWPVVRLSDGK